MNANFGFCSLNSADCWVENANADRSDLEDLEEEDEEGAFVLPSMARDLFLDMIRHRLFLYDSFFYWYPNGFGIEPWGDDVSQTNSAWCQKLLTDNVVHNLECYY